MIAVQSCGEKRNKGREEELSRPKFTPTISILNSISTQRVAEPACSSFSPTPLSITLTTLYTRWSNQTTSESKMSPSPPACLCSLPPEIILRIIRYYLDPRSITRLAATCTILHDLARSEIVWKEIVLRLVDQHGVSSFAGSNHHHFQSSTNSTSSTWWQQARWLLPNARHLGYFLSSIPFR